MTFVSPPAYAGLLMNKTLESTATQHTIGDLSPGRLYNVTMVTESGGLQSSATIKTQTGREEEVRKDGEKGRQKSDEGISFQFWT